MSFDNPIKKDGHLVILRGNIAPHGAVAKISGKEGTYFKGVAKVFGSEEKMSASYFVWKNKKGDSNHNKNEAQLEVQV